MRKSINAATVLAVVLSMAVPARAEVIADQSRISVSAPMAPNIDPVILPESKRVLLWR